MNAYAEHGWFQKKISHTMINCLCRISEGILKKRGIKDTNGGKFENRKGKFKNRKSLKTGKFENRK